jgi:hypothetical protein
VLTGEVEGGFVTTFTSFMVKLDPTAKLWDARGDVNDMTYSVADSEIREHGVVWVVVGEFIPL